MGKVRSDPEGADRDRRRGIRMNPPELSIDAGQEIVIKARAFSEAWTRRAIAGKKNKSKVTVFDDGENYPLNHQVYFYTDGTRKGSIWVSNGHFAGNYPSRLFPHMVISQIASYGLMNNQSIDEVLKMLNVWRHNDGKKILEKTEIEL